MIKFLSLFFVIFCIVSGNPNIALPQEIDDDIRKIDIEIENANATAQEYSGGLVLAMINVRLEVLKLTKSMLEQKNAGIKKFFKFSYSIDGKKYSPPENKDELLKNIENDLENLKKDMADAETESQKYIGGLLKVLSLTTVVTVKNSIAFLDQKRLLLKHDIPWYPMLPHDVKDDEAGFKPTPGKDIDKF